MLSSLISDRLNRIHDILDDYALISGDDSVDQATDLVADLLHWCQAQSVPPTLLLDRAKMHFLEEYEEEDSRTLN